MSHVVDVYFSLFFPFASELWPIRPRRRSHTHFLSPSQDVLVAAFLIGCAEFLFLYYAASVARVLNISQAYEISIIEFFAALDFVDPSTRTNHTIDDVRDIRLLLLNFSQHLEFLKDEQLVRLDRLTDWESKDPFISIPKHHFEQWDDYCERLYATLGQAPDSIHPCKLRDSPSADIASFSGGRI